MDEPEYTPSVWEMMQEMKRKRAEESAEKDTGEVDDG